MSKHSSDAVHVAARRRQSGLEFPEEARSFAPPAITARQIQCLYWVQHGKSATDIGAILGISGRTVEKHLIKLCGHFGVKTRVQAVVRARDLGFLNRPTP